MPDHLDFSADLILVCNSLAEGGIERVVSTLANEWTRRGRKVCVITMHDRQRFFTLDPAVHHVIVDRAGVTWLAECLRKITSRFEGVRLPKSLLITLFGADLYHLFAEKVYRVNFRMYLAYEAWMLRRVLERVEGTPNALLEAMSCGLPVIVSDGAPGPLELIEDGVNGLVVPVNDAVALASALCRLASDGELRSRLGKAARERVSEYDLPRALAAWETIVGLTC